MTAFPSTMRLLPALLSRLLPALCAAGAGLALAVAPARAAGGPERVVIDYWEKWSGFEADAMRAVIQDFNASQDGIEVRFLTVSPIDVKLLLAASSGHPPDVAGLWEYNLPDFAEKGALLPLDAALAEAGLGADHYVPVYWELCRHRGFTWALPTTPGCIALFYNKRLFREAGLDPERPPRTLAELNALDRRLTRVELERAGRTVRVGFDQLTEAERAGRRYRLVQVGHLPQDAGMFVSAWGLWFGARYHDGAGRILADSPENLAAYRWMEEATRTYGLDHLRDFSAAYGQSQTSQSPFLGGNAAMVAQGPWMKNFIERYAPDLEWGVAPFPAAAGVADDAPPTLVVSDMIVIPRGAKHPREAFAFIRYLQRQEVAEKLARLQQKFTALRAVSADFVAGHPNPAIREFIALAHSPGARHIPRLANWREYDIEMTIAAMRVRYLLSPPEEALAVVQRRLQRSTDRLTRRWSIIGAERLKEWSEHERW